MNESFESGARRAGWGLRVMETITAGVLVLVLVALIWMVLASYWPARFCMVETSFESLVSSRC